MKTSNIDNENPLDLWTNAVLGPDATIQQGIENLEATAVQIVMVVGKDGELMGTISDGDIRRGLLKELPLDSSIKTIMHHNPLVVHGALDRETVLQLMQINKVRQVPVVDESNKVIGLHLWDQVTTPVSRPNKLVIMAGGKGMRLRPYTEECPKPMLQVGGKPMLEHIIERARTEGFTDIILAVHYLAHMIEDYFGDGKKLGVNIDYIREDRPLGTAGALSLLKAKPTDAIVVTNGDVITDIRYGELLDFHKKQEAHATMAVRLHEWQHPFGVVRLKGLDIDRFEEKPTYRSHINAGVYALDPEAIENLSHASPCDMPTLFEALQNRGNRTVAYPMHEPWLDVGRPDDLKLADTNSAE